MEKQTASRGHFSSSLGFILAATGSAIGLGNLWKFPYVAGSSGGGYFVIFYLLFTLILGVPLMLTEISIGRKTKLNPIGAFRKLDKKWSFVGATAVIASFIILSYYSVVGGWVLKYFFTYITGANFGENTSKFFTDFIASPVEPVVWHLLFLAVTTTIVIGGISKGIEKVSKIMLPGLFILMIIIAIRSLTLDGASEGVKFFLKPDGSQFSSFSSTLSVMGQALGQVFFSLSLGTGIAITYGSYLKKDSNLPKNATIIAGLDALIAILAGLTILPAVFALGFEPAAGPGLIFETLPAVFASMPLGAVFGTVFFILVFFAAVTSAMSMLEVVTSYFIDTFGMKRRNASILLASMMGIVGIFASLSFGPLGNISFFGMNIFDSLGFITDKILMPLTSIMTCIFIGHRYKVSRLAEEIEIGTKNGTFTWKRLYNFIISWVAPALILFIFIFEII